MAGKHKLPTEVGTGSDPAQPSAAEMIDQASRDAFREAFEAYLRRSGPQTSPSPQARGRGRSNQTSSGRVPSL